MLFNPKRGDIKLGQVMLLSTSGSGLSLISHIRLCVSYLCSFPWKKHVAYEWLVSSYKQEK